MEIFQFGAQWLSRLQKEQERRTILEINLGLKATSTAKDESAFIQDEVYFLRPVALEWFSALILVFPQAISLKADALRVMHQWQTFE